MNERQIIQSSMKVIDLDARGLMPPQPLLVILEA